MAAGKNPFTRIRLVCKPSSTAVKCIILAALVLSTAALLMLRGAISDAKQQEEAMRQEAIRLEQQNRDLGEDIAQLGTVQSVKDLAARYFGLVDPDTVIFLPEQ